MKLRPDPRQARDEREAAEAALRALPAGDVLLGYQRTTVEALFSGVSLLVIEKSRRIGLTWALAAYAVMRAGAGRSEAGSNVWYMGYDLEMAREFIDTCAMWARAFSIAAEAADEELVEGAGEKVQAFRLRLASGFKIVALPSVPRALRGKQGLVIVDEAAFHKDLAEVLKAAIALLIWGGQVVVVSTHDGVANPFNILLDEIRAGERKGATLTITFDDALADGLYERVALVSGGKTPPRAEWIADIRQTYGDNAEEELDCVPKQGAGSWLSPEALAGCEHPEAGEPERYAGGLVYLGRDVARRRDLAVIHGYELVGDVLWMRHRVRLRNESFQEQDDAAARIIRDCRVSRYFIDQTGMGEKVVEDEQRRYGSTRVTGVLLTGPSRLELAIALKDRVDRGLIRIPPCPDLRADLRAIQKQGGIGGSIRIVNEGKVHADEFWAAALACQAAEIAYQPFAYRPVRAERDAPSAARFAGRRGLY